MHVAELKEARERNEAQALEQAVQQSLVEVQPDVDVHTIEETDNNILSDNEPQYRAQSVVVTVSSDDSDNSDNSNNSDNSDESNVDGYMFRAA